MIPLKFYRDFPLRHLLTDSTCLWAGLVMRWLLILTFMLFPSVHSGLPWSPRLARSWRSFLCEYLPHSAAEGGHTDTASHGYWLASSNRSKALSSRDTLNLRVLSIHFLKNKHFPQLPLRDRTKVPKAEDTMCFRHRTQRPLSRNRSQCLFNSYICMYDQLMIKGHLRLGNRKPTEATHWDGYAISGGRCWWVILVKVVSGSVPCWSCLLDIVFGGRGFKTGCPISSQHST